MSTDGEQPPRENSDFSNEIYVAPFGRYEVAAPTEAPTNEVLVGRERERARVVDWLLTGSRSGALLVTGHRGVGKSRFVDFCLGEFEQDVYKRYLRSTIGRVFFWDFFLIVFLILVALFVPLVGSTVLEIIFTGEARPTPTPIVLWNAMVAIPLLLLCAFPWVYAWGTTRAACDVPSDGGATDVARFGISGESWGRFGACFIAYSLAVILGPFADPVTGAAYLVCMAAWLYAAVRALSIQREQWPLAAPVGEASSTDFDSLNWAGKQLFRISLVFGGVTMALPSASPERPLDVASHLERYDLALQYLLATLPFFAVGVGLRAFDAMRLQEFLDCGQKQKEEEEEEEEEKLPRAHSGRIFRAGGRRVHYARLAVGFLVASLTTFAVYWESLPVNCACALACLLLALAIEQRVVLGWGGDRKLPAAVRLVPRGRYVLAFKALFCFVAALQLLTPFVIWLIASAHEPGSELGFVPSFLDKWLPQLSLLRRQLEPVLGTDYIRNGVVSSGAAIGVWSAWSDELGWSAVAAAFVVQIVSMEYSWIVRRLERERLDSAHSPDRNELIEARERRLSSFAPASNESSQGGDATTPAAKPAAPDGRSRLANARELASATLFWLLYQTWMPVLSVRVNLGFDAPSHTRVVEAMLVGLRESYHRVFVSWRSRIGIGMLLAQVTVALVVTFAVGERFFRTDDWPRDLLGKRDVVVFDTEDRRARSDSRAFAYVLPYESMVDEKGQAQRKIVFRLHHLALFVLLFLSCRMLLRKADLFGSVDRGLTDLLHKLSSTVKVTSGSPSARWKVGDMELGAPSEGREVLTTPQDPRAVENAFHQVLHRIVVPYLQLPVRRHIVSLPAPEVVFVFDELDKIGGRPLLARSGAPELTLEGTRTQQLHALFADMKSLLSTAPARFVFVGGRNLHDEWLADQTQLRPLLSSIFDIEVYLPTLLSDPIPVGTNDPEPSRGTEAFLNAQLVRVNHLHARWQRDKRVMGRISAPQSPELLFVQKPLVRERQAEGLGHANVPAGSDADLASEHPLAQLPIVRSGLERVHRPKWSAELIDCWIQYLTFRSRGIPRALNELLEGFVRPIGRIVDREDDRATYFDCQHVIYFGDVDRYRVQFVASLYRQLCGRPMEQRLSRSASAEQLVRRRDETVQTAFYLADVLFKFHPRAFSWSNLERIDELAHVHAPAGIRHLLERVVQAFSETHITTTTSGIYDFRFRSESEAEIRYVSRHSPKEMAALNFTLDESQALRQHYLQRLAAADAGSHARYELEAAVGELYDFDERYEHARGHYARAIQALDDRLKAVHGPESAVGILTHVYSSSAGQSVNRRYSQWGVARLRLMLQIGMTYERTRNFELAVGQYRDARTLSRAIWRGMLDDRGRGDSGPRAQGKHQLETLELLPIVYQSLFALAWLAEKGSNAPGASTSMLERGLWDLRTRLPSVREPGLPDSGETRLKHHMAFFLSMSDLHQSTAQLYFFRGNECHADGKKRDGQLLMAQYHCLVALHELRRAVSASTATSKDEPPLSSAERYDPLGSDAILRRAACALLGLAETWAARVRVASSTATGSKTRTAALTQRDFDGWMRGECDVALFGTWNRAPIPAPGPKNPEINLVYSWKEKRAVAPVIDDPYSRGWRRLVTVDHPEESELVPAYVSLSELAVGLLERANDPCEAARESVRRAAALENLVTCSRSLAWIPERSNPISSHVRELRPPGDPSPRLWLIEQAVKALKCADKLLLEKHGQRSATLGDGNIDRILPHARTIAATLGLHAAALRPSPSTAEWDTVCRDIGELVGGWKSYAKQSFTATNDRAMYRAVLCDTLRFQAYPMLNRLGALRALIIDAALESSSQDDQAVCHDHVLELVRLNALYASPWHFTPYHAGVAVGLWAVRLDKVAADKRPVHHGEVAAYALRSLRASVSMAAGGSVYSNQLNDLYYLDGDFSDRCIHSRHSHQLMGSELTVALIKYVDSSAHDSGERQAEVAEVGE